MTESTTGAESATTSTPTESAVGEPGEGAAAAEGVAAAPAAEEVSEKPAPKKRRTRRKAKAAEAAPEIPTGPTVEELAAQLDAQAKALEENAAQTGRLKMQLREAAIDKLGILPHYRADVPDFDVTTAEGKVALQKWAQARPEIRATQPAASQPTVQAEQALKDLRSPHLVNADWFRKALAEA